MNYSIGIDIDKKARIWKNGISLFRGFTSMKKAIEWLKVNDPEYIIYVENRKRGEKL